MIICKFNAVRCDVSFELPQKPKKVIRSLETNLSVGVWLTFEGKSRDKIKDRKLGHFDRDVMASVASS